MKYFSALRTRDVISLILFIVAGFGWILIDQHFFSETYQRIIALFLVIIILFFFQFLIHRPDRIVSYTNTLVFITVLFVLVMSVVMHIIIHHDYSYRGLIILGITAVTPYGSAGIYSLVIRRKNPRKV